MKSEIEQNIFPIKSHSLHSVERDLLAYLEEHGGIRVTIEPHETMTGDIWYSMDKMEALRGYPPSFSPESRKIITGRLDQLQHYFEEAENSYEGRSAIYHSPLPGKRSLDLLRDFIRL